MLGLTKREVARRFDEIVEFAELQEFIDAPVKTYSSGMYMRLGFAVAIHVDPDVLLVDEVLAVGDEGFTHKCLDKFAEFRRRGKTILLVTHSLAWSNASATRRSGSTAGGSQAHGDPRRVVDAYLTAVEKGEEKLLAATTAKAVASASSPSRSGTRTGAGSERGPGAIEKSTPPRKPVTTAGAELQNMFQAVEGRWGSREIEIADVTLLDRRPAAVLRVSLRRSDVRAAEGRARTRRPPTSCSASACSTPTASAVTARTRSSRRWIRSGSKAKSTSRFAIDSLDLVEGTYKLDVAVHKLRRLPVRLSPAALHVPRQVADPRRRHLPPASPLDVFSAGVRFKARSGCVS